MTACWSRRVQCDVYWTYRRVWVQHSVSNIEIHKIMTIINWNETRIRRFLFIFYKTSKVQTGSVYFGACARLMMTSQHAVLSWGIPSLGFPFSPSMSKTIMTRRLHTVKSHHSKVIYPLYCIVHYSNQRSSHLWIDRKWRLQSISSKAGGEEWKSGAMCHGVPVSISDILCSNFGLDLYSRFKFRPVFQAKKGLSTYTRRRLIHDNIR